MSAPSKPDQGRTFDGAAALYDAQRSGYPRNLFADLMAIGRLRVGDRALEIGCGSGQATEGLLAEGLEVIGLDPGASLLDLARQKFAGSARVRFEASTFEQWPLEDRKFHLVAAAQSWHWVAPEAGFAKAADALLPDGKLAIFGHTPMWSAELIGSLQPIYARLAPELWSRPGEVWYLPEGPIPDLIAASGVFERPENRSYVWRRAYSARAFAGYLGTRSEILRLPRERRDALLQAVENGVPELVETDWVTNLYVSSLRS
jgi:SAM-dependent methyltransferase